ncbi:MAG: hypothetical protein RL065_147 [Bacteroidota bacterium]
MKSINSISSLLTFAILFLFSNTTIAQKVSISASHSMAFCGDSLYSWGNLIDSTYLEPKKVTIPALQKYKSIHALSGASFAIDTAGFVWSWGANYSGMLGIGNTIQNLTPLKVHGIGNVGFLTNIKALSGRNQSAFALANDSIVFSWGSNSTGVLGDGTIFNTRTSPVKVIDYNSVVLDSIIQISSSSEHALAVDANGNVWVWGRNYYGEAGIGTTNTYISQAVQVLNSTGIGILSNVKSVSAGTHFSLALKNDGTVWAWGNNNVGQLGINTSTNINLPTQVTDITGNQFLTNIVSIEAGDGFAMALSSSGKVYMWGNNRFGILAQIDYKLNSKKPIQLKNLPIIKNIYCGDDEVAAETNNGDLLMWGVNYQGNLGNNENNYYILPLTNVLDANGTSKLNNVKQISAGMEHQAILKNDGSVWAWGNHSTNLASASYSQIPLPLKVFDSTGTNYLTGIQSIATGNIHNLALGANGKVYGWGSNSDYCLGANATGSYYYKAIAIRDFNNLYLKNVKKIAAGSKASMFLHNDSTVSWCGRLYVNSLNSYSYAFPFKMKDSSGITALTKVISVAAGGNNIYAVTADGQVWAAGNNDFGQLGLGNNSANYGVRLVKDSSGIQPLKHIVSISIKQNSIFAVTDSGTVWAWGDNGHGQLGVGDTTFSFKPRMVLDSSGINLLKNVKQISMGDHHALALMNDSTAWGWGFNVYGEACDATTTQRVLPSRIMLNSSTLLKNIISVQAGSFFSSILLSNQTVLSNGYNYYGQTGTKPTFGENVPQLVHLNCKSFPPTAEFMCNNNIGCINDNIQFTDTSSHIPSSWLWQVNGPSNFTSTVQHPQFQFTQAGNYQVSLTTSNYLGNSSTTKSNFITIDNNPVALFSITIDTLNKKITTSNSSQYSTSYNWDFGDGNTDTSSNPIHQYANYGSYQVCLISTNHCGYFIICDSVKFIKKDTVVINGLYNNISSTKNSISVYPNPSNELLNVKCDKLISSIEIKNLIGQTMNCTISNLNSNHSLINLSNLPNGIYFIQTINVNGEISNLKFTKE